MSMLLFIFRKNTLYEFIYVNCIYEQGAAELKFSFYLKQVFPVGLDTMLLFML